LPGKFLLSIVKKNRGWPHMQCLKTFHRHLLLFSIFLLLISTGCSWPLEVSYDPRTEGPYKSDEPVPVHVAPFEDKRDLSKARFKDPKTIGSILSTVSDMTGSELTLSESPARIVTMAFAKELAIAGFSISEPNAARYVVSGEVREFKLDIGPKDDVAIEFSYTLKEAGTDKTLSTGVASEKGERFAGVMGNSRTTLSNYIASTVQKAVRRSIEEFGPKMTAAKDAPVAEEAGGRQDASAGTLVLKSTPGRAKVYIDGVYYGLTPLNLELAPGIYEVEIKNKGYRTTTEKVSVRQDATTELETELEEE